MKFSLALAAAAASLVAAAGLSSLPTCALPCLSSSIPQVGCSLDDTACQCDPAKQAALVPIAGPCLISACSPSDLASAQAAASADCAAYAASATGAPSSIPPSSADSTIPPSGEPSTLIPSATASSNVSVSTPGAPAPSAPSPTVVTTGGAGTLYFSAYLALFLVAVAAL